MTYPRRRCRAHHRVYRGQMLGQDIQPRGFCLQQRGAGFRAGLRAIGQHQFTDPNRAQVPRRLHPGAAGADNQHAAFADAELGCQALHCRRCHRQRANADGGLRASQAASPQRRHHHALDERSRAGAGVHGRSHLPQDLGFAEHQRLQAAAHAEQMVSGSPSAQPYFATRHLAGREAHHAIEQGQHGLVVSGHARPPVDFRAIAGGQHEPLDTRSGERGVQFHPRSQSSAVSVSVPMPTFRTLRVRNTQRGKAAELRDCVEMRLCRDRRTKALMWAAVGLGHVSAARAEYVARRGPAIRINTDARSVELRSRGRFDDPFANGHLNQHRHRFHAQLVHQVGAMRLDACGR